MKKIFGLFFILTILFFCSNMSFASFPAGERGTVAVVADFSGKGEVDFSFDIKEISDDSSTQTINWDARKILAGQDKPQWVWSTSYAVVRATITSGNVNFYMYQKNTDSSSVYRSTWSRIIAVYYEDGYTPTGDDSIDRVHRTSATFAYSGMVNKVTKGGDYAGFVPLSFLFTSAKLSAADLKQTYDPEIMTQSGDKVARYFTDEADYIEYYSNGEVTRTESNFKKEYTILARVGGPVFGVYDEEGHYAPWRPALVDNTAYMYFGGNFMNIKRGDGFATDKIVIMKVVE